MEENTQGIALTWRDMFEIFNITRTYMAELDAGPVQEFPDSTEELYDEVLRRYLEWKGRAPRISSRTSPKTTPPVSLARKVIFEPK